MKIVIYELITDEQMSRTFGSDLRFEKNNATFVLFVFGVIL